MKNNYLLLFLFIVFLTIPFSSKASHLLGSDLTYECISPNQYRVTLQLYRDCNGIIPLSSQTLEVASIECGASFNVNLNQVGTQSDITPLCPTETSGCSGSSGFGVELWTYQGILNLQPGCGSDWVIGWSQCCRNDAINTLNSPDAQDMYVGANIDNTLNPCNSSPIFNNGPGSIVCVDQPYVYNHGVSDLDGDSLFFSLGNCLQDNNFSVVYSGGFNATNPISTASGVSINPQTGSLSFTPNQVQVGVVCVLVEEFRNGVKIGQVMRDMQFTVTNCNNVPPQASGVNGSPNTNPINFESSICANGQLCFTIDMTDPDGDIISTSWNQEIPSATFTITGNNTTAPTAEFCWSPTMSDIGTQFFTVNVEDDNCPIIGSGTYTYTIEVLPSPNSLNAGADQSICFGETASLSATSSGATSFTWSPTSSLNTSTGANVVATPLSTTTYTVASNFPDGCNLTDNVTVTVLPNPQVSISPQNVFNCSGQTNTLTAVAPSATSFLWDNGAGNTASVDVTPAVTTTYTVIVENAQGCENSASTTVNIAAPTNTACNVLYVSTTGSPSGDGSKANPMDLQTALQAGACNGTILKMATGDYVTDSTIRNITSYITLEGGFQEGVNWDKISTPGATRILRTAVANTSLTQGVDDATGSAPRVTALEINSQEGFRLQDITIEVDDSGITGTMAGMNAISTYGIYLNACTDYNLIRTRVIGGDATNGNNGTTPIGSGGAGVAGGTGGIGSAQISGCGGNVSQGGTGNSGNGGALGGTGGAGFGADGCNLIGCDGAQLDGNNGNTGQTGATGSSFAPNDRPSTPAVSGTFFVPASAAADGGNGFSGGGGGGGSGGSIGTDCLCNSGSGNAFGGNGGTGGAGGIGGTGGLGGGSSYGVFIVNNGNNGIINNANISAGNAGLGGSGAVGQPGASGSSGQNGGFHSRCDDAFGGDGGTGGNGGNGGRGRDGANGEAVNVKFISGTPLATNNSNFNLAAQPIIDMSDVSCTFNTTDFSSSSSAVWNFGQNSNPGSDNGSSVSTQYETIGRKTIMFNGNDYLGFANIIIDAGSPLTITTSAPLINSQFKICAGSSVNFTANDGGVGYTYNWEIFGSSFSPSLAFDSINETTGDVTFNEPGIHFITLGFESNCCGSSVPDTLELFVEEQPVLNVSPLTAELCTGSNTPIQISVDDNINNGTISWTPTNGIDDPNSFTVELLPSDSTIYTVNVVDTSGLCSATENVSINVVDLELSVSTTDANCGNDGSASVTAIGGSGDYSYLWDSNAANQMTATANNLQIGTYLVVVTDNILGCQDSVFATITGSSPVGFITGGNMVSCFGESDGTLQVNVANGTAPYNYVWSPLGGTFNNVSATTNISNPIPAGDYTVSITDANGCTYVVDGFVSEPDSINIVVDSLFNPTCVGIDDGYISVIADGGNGGITYEWDDPSMQMDQAAVGLSTGTFCVTATDLMGCEKTACYTLTAPLATSTINTSSCQFEDYLLPDGTIINPTSDTTSIDTISTALGCDSVVTSNIVVNPIFSEVITGTFCFNDAFTTPSGNNITLQTDTLFVDSLQTVSGCDSLFTIDLTVLDEKLNTITDTVCFGESITVNGTVYDSDVIGAIEVVSNVGPFNCDSTITINLEVLDEKLTTITDTICFGDSIVVNGTVYNTDVSGAIEVATNVGPFNCDSTITINLEVLDEKLTTITDTICFGDSIVVNGTVYDTDVSGAIEVATNVGPFNCDSTITINLEVLDEKLTVITDTVCFGESITVNGTVYDSDVIGAIEVINNVGPFNCDSTITVNLEVLDEKVNTINQTLCFGENITVNGTVYDANNTAGTEVVSNVGPFDCDSIITVNIIVLDEKLSVVDTSICEGESLTINGTVYETTTTGAIEVINDNSTQNCDSTVTINLTVNPTPSISAVADPDTVFADDNSSTLIATGNGSFTIDGLSGDSTLLVNPEETQTYTIEILDANGCVNETTVTVYVITRDVQLVMPDAFTPNGDGRNDVFEVLNKENFAEIELRVYNRWGEIIHQGSGQNHQWDGNYKGKAQPMDTYFFNITVVSIVDGEIFKMASDVTLIR